MNLVHSYSRELQYWQNVWDAKNPDILMRMDESKKFQCPDFVINVVQNLSLSLGRKPKAIDFGCGPFSNIRYINGTMAELIGVDVLAEDYEKFYSKNNISAPIPLIKCSGERLCEKFPNENFDFTFTQNALDHTLAPILTWLNLYRITKVDGVIGHCHAIDEATYQNKDQLHQFNLTLQGSDFIIDDLEGHRSSLVDGLDLELIYMNRFEVEPDKMTRKIRPDYFCHIYKKNGKRESSEFLVNVLENLRKSLIKRSEWAIELEKILL